MANSLARREAAEVARPLKVLVPLIKGAIAKGDEAGLEYYRQAGEMLLEAKEQVSHGGWRRWLEGNFHLSISTAQNYMRLAERLLGEKRSALRDHTLSSITRPAAPTHHRQAWHEPVRQVVQRVDVSALAADEQARAKERRLTHELALQLIDIGYRVLVTKLHPDKGGSTEAMTRLNRVRDVLRRAV